MIQYVRYGIFLIWSKIMDIINFVWLFLGDLYNSGGPRVRWVLWFWVAFLFLYLIIGKYERIHAGNY